MFFEAEEAAELLVAAFALVWLELIVRHDVHLHRVGGLVDSVAVLVLTNQSVLRPW